MFCSNKYINCFGIGSCNDIVLIGNRYPIRVSSETDIVGPFAVVNAEVTSSDRYSTFDFEGRLAMVNSTIILNYANERYGRVGIRQVFTLYIQSDYALWNVSVVCQDRGYEFNCDFWCTDNGSPQFVTIDPSCGNLTGRCRNNCTFIDSIDDIDSETISIVNDISDLMNNYELLYEYQCSDDSTGSNNSLYFDVGYPLYGESFIANDEYQRCVAILVVFFVFVCCLVWGFVRIRHCGSVFLSLVAVRPANGCCNELAAGRG